MCAAADACSLSARAWELKGMHGIHPDAGVSLYKAFSKVLAETTDTASISRQQNVLLKK